MSCSGYCTATTTVERDRERMSQCVPHWDLDDGLARPPQIHASTSTTTNRNHARMSGFVASELTWANGPHGGALRLDKPVPKRPSPVAMTWGKPLEGGTLEVVVEQATRAPALDPTAAAAHCSPISTRCHLVPWLGSPLLPVPAAVDALVPSAESHPQDAEERRASSHLVRGSAAGTTDGGGTCAAWCSGRNRLGLGAGSVRVSVGTAQLCAGSIGLTLDTCETNGDGGMEDFTALASPLDGSPEKANTSCRRPPPTVSEDHDDSGDGRRSQDGCDEEGRSKNEKRGPSISTKRGRAAAVHNQAERRRRDRINQRMTTLQKLLPNSSKTDKASILDEVIGYVKQLQAQVQMMSRMNTAVTHMMTMMMPMALQQPQTAMMAQMGMAMGMGMVDVNTLGGAGKTGMPWPAFLPPAMSSSAVRDRDLLQAPGVALPPDPFAAFMACQAQQQPMAMDAYRRMAALHQQLYQLRPGSNHDNT